MPAGPVNRQLVGHGRPKRDFESAVGMTDTSCQAMSGRTGSDASRRAQLEYSIQMTSFSILGRAGPNSRLKAERSAERKGEPSGLWLCTLSGLEYVDALRYGTTAVQQLSL